MAFRLRFYYNGELKSSKEYDTLRRPAAIIDRAESDWSRNLMPQILPGEFDPNNGSEVSRSANELLVTTTGGHKLRWIIKETAR